MPPLPTPEILSGYEKLGIIGILLLVLCVGLVIIVWAVRQGRSISREVLAYLTQQLTQQAINSTQVKESLEQQNESCTRMHERMDGLLSCARSGCPVFEMRKKQQKEAAKEATRQAAALQPSPDRTPGSPVNPVTA